MFPIICKIGPINLSAYIVTAAVFAGAGLAVLFVAAVLGHLKREVVVTTLFWVLFLAVGTMSLLLTTVTVYSYGLMMALAVVLCTVLLSRDAADKHIPPDMMIDFVFWVMVAGIIGARLFYIILNYKFFLDNPGEIMMIQHGGLAWQGGLLLGAVTAMTWVKRKGLFLPEVLDLCAPYLALGQSIGRIGCFLNGCCYGKEVSWGIYFPVHHAHLHPTQLYLSGGLFLVFLILKKYRSSSSIPGLVFASYLILASALRFGVEFFRADHEVLFLGLSVFQYVCLGILAFACGFAYVMLIKHSDPPEDSR